MPGLEVVWQVDKRKWGKAKQLSLLIQTLRARYTNSRAQFLVSLSPWMNAYVNPTDEDVLLFILQLGMHMQISSTHVEHINMMMTSNGKQLKEKELLCLYFAKKHGESEGEKFNKCRAR